MQLSIPEPVPYAEVAAVTSIANDTGDDDDDGRESIKDQIMSMLDLADEAAKMARKEWEALGKLGADVVRCVNCEEWWRASIKDIIRACIACSIAVATMKRGYQTAVGKPIRDVLTAEMPRAGQRYHDFWIVPKLTVRRA